MLCCITCRTGNDGADLHTLNEKKLKNHSQYLATLIQGVANSDVAEHQSLCALTELMDELQHPNSE